MRLACCSLAVGRPARCCAGKLIETCSFASFCKSAVCTTASTPWTSAFERTGYCQLQSWYECRGVALILKPHAQSMQAPVNCFDLAVPTCASRSGQTLLHTSSWISAGPSDAPPDSPEQKKGVPTDPDVAPPKDDRQSTPSNKKTNELVSQTFSASYSCSACALYTTQIMLHAHLAFLYSCSFSRPCCLSCMHLCMTSKNVSIGSC